MSLSAAGGCAAGFLHHPDVFRPRGCPRRLPRDRRDQDAGVFFTLLVRLSVRACRSRRCRRRRRGGRDRGADRRPSRTAPDPRRRRKRPVDLDHSSRLAPRPGPRPLGVLFAELPVEPRAGNPPAQPLERQAGHRRRDRRQQCVSHEFLCHVRPVMSALSCPPGPVRQVLSPARWPAAIVALSPASEPHAR
jgi:hypothetical protein